MNQKFFELPLEKQMSIVNAALEVFAKNDYKRALTDEIAQKAGISKGLLFYYFGNKKELFLFVYEYCQKQVEQYVDVSNIPKMDDFFEILEYGANRKIELLTKVPYIMEFSLKAYFCEDKMISPDFKKDIQTKIEGAYQAYFSHINMTKFRDGINMQQLLQMLTWMTEGYLYSYKSIGVMPTLDEIMKNFREWSDMFKKMAYREEYLV